MKIAGYKLTKEILDKAPYSEYAVSERASIRPSNEFYSFVKINKNNWLLIDLKNEVEEKISAVEILEKIKNKVVFARNLECGWQDENYPCSEMFIDCCEDNECCECEEDNCCEEDN